MEKTKFYELLVKARYDEATLFSISGNRPLPQYVSNSLNKCNCV